MIESHSAIVDVDMSLRETDMAHCMYERSESPISKASQSDSPQEPPIGLALSHYGRVDPVASIMYHEWTRGIGRH